MVMTFPMTKNRASGCTSCRNFLTFLWTSVNLFLTHSLVITNLGVGEQNFFFPKNSSNEGRMSLLDTIVPEAVFVLILKGVVGMLDQLCSQRLCTVTWVEVFSRAGLRTSLQTIFFSCLTSCYELHSRSIFKRLLS